MDETKPGGRHSLQVVARRTGMAPRAIRELDTDRESWSDADVERLLMLSRLVRLGRTPDSLRYRNDEELATLIALAEARATEGTRTGRLMPPETPVLERAVEAMLSTRSDELRRLLSASLATVGRTQLLHTLLIPLAAHLARLEAEGTLRSFHEHLAAACVNSVLPPDPTPTGAEPRGTVVLATPSGESHELELLVAAEVARGAGYGVRSLGTGVPVLRLAAVGEADPAPVVLVVSRPPVLDLLVEELTFLAGRWQGGPLLVHGRRAGEVGDRVRRKLRQRPSPHPVMPMRVVPGAADLDSLLRLPGAFEDDLTRTHPRAGTADAPERSPAPHRPTRPGAGPPREPRRPELLEGPGLHRSTP